MSDKKCTLQSCSINLMVKFYGWHIVRVGMSVFYDQVSNHSFYYSSLGGCQNEFQYLQIYHHIKFR